MKYPADYVWLNPKGGKVAHFYLELIGEMQGFSRPVCGGATRRTTVLAANPEARQCLHCARTAARRIAA